MSVIRVIPSGGVARVGVLGCLQEEAFTSAEREIVRLRGVSESLQSVQTV